MTKTILFATAFALFSLVGFNATPAQACDTCGCSGAHAHPHGDHDMKKKPCEKTLGKKAPCTKCADAGKPCMCGDKTKKPCEKVLGEKAPCEKTLGKKAKKECCGACGKGKPCTKTLSKSNASQGNHKGSLVLKSKQKFKSRDALNYNE